MPLPNSKMGGKGASDNAGNGLLNAPEGLGTD